MDSDRIRIGFVGNIQIESVSARYEDPKLLAPLLELYTKADAMGLLPARPIVELSPATLKTVLDAFRSRGLLGTLPPRLETLLKGPPSERATKDAVSALSAILTAIDESPAPEKEWTAMRKVFVDDDLERLLNISPSSLKRYASTDRATPDDIADRLHWMAMVVAALSGSYNEIGIRRWFERPRAQLDGRSPRDALGADWNPSSPDARKVRELADSLASLGAT